MKHAFTTQTGTAGIWLTGAEEVFCRWRWDAAARKLVVEAGGVTRSWSSPDLDLSGESGIQLDLPETARDVAHLARREQPAS